MSDTHHIPGGCLRPGASLASPESGAVSPIAADVHMHTCHSHAAATVGDMFEAAKARGLSVIGFSEHSPRPAGYSYADDYQEKLTAGFPSYVSEVLALQPGAAAQGVTVLLGLEADYIAGEEAFTAALCREYPFDYIIGGLHFQGAWGFDGGAAEWERLSEAERFAAYERYYEDLAAMCRTGLFHIAAHPDLIKLFTVQSFHSWLAQKRSSERVRETLSVMKECGVLMEISSAGLRKPCKEIYPCEALMRMAAEIALPISFASDAHCVNTPAYAFADLARYAARFGYTHSNIVRAGVPHALPFDRV